MFLEWAEVVGNFQNFAYKIIFEHYRRYSGQVGVDVSPANFVNICAYRACGWGRWD